MENQNLQDFRIQLYNKYRSTFKNFIELKSDHALKSEFVVFQKRYLHLLNHLSLDTSILDVGCGNGYVMQFLKDSGYLNVFGIDISNEQVEYSKSKGLEVEVNNIFEFVKKSKKKFDVIFAMDIIEHFYKNELIELFEGLNSLLTENGILIIHTPNGDGIFPQHIIYGDLTHLTIFNPRSLEQILRLTNFEDISCFETGPTTKNLKGIIRLFFWNLIRFFYKTVKTIETGGAVNVLTQDFICIAKK